ncbi:MAG: serine hydrolase domain-containing protein [Candidatus Cyclobacteriaceae bacterium M2_1C_046]
MNYSNLQKFPGLLSVRRITGTLLVICLFHFTGWSQTKNVDRILKDALENAIVLGMPGISVAIGKGDTIAWTGTAGYTDLMEKKSVSTEDKFGIGSITKSFVAMTVLQLVQEGKLDLEKVPTDYIDLEIVKKVPNVDKSPIKYLLNHQSGIPTWEFQPEWIRKGRGEEMDISHIWSKTETLEYVTDDKVEADFEPGQKYAYSNTNYTILGLIVEAITGNDAMTEIRKRFLDPLNMKNTYLESFEDIPGGHVDHYHHATSTFREVAGVHKSFPEIHHYLVESSAANLSPEWVAGGMVASASDLVHWAQALRDEKFPGPEIHKMLFTYDPPAEGKNDSFEYMQGIYRSKDNVNGFSVVGHSGGTLGFTAMMFWIEDTDIIVVALTNVGSMHSGLRQSPLSTFYKNVLMPSVIEYFNKLEK